MDPERIKRRQSLKVIISETIMTLTVVLTVIVLALVVSGYWVNSDFEIERQGLLQISSIPTGADVTIDGGSSWLQRTNTSKVLSSGEHEVSLTKEEYDSWSKTINISEGLLYRLHYPRLFLKERTKEKAFTGLGVTFATVSPTSEHLLLADQTTTWKLLNLENEKITEESLLIADYFSGTEENLFTSTINSAKWSGDGSRVLFNTTTTEGTTEWVILDIRNLTRSLNLTKLFDASFNQIEIVDDSASTLLAKRDGNLHKINTSDKSISAVLVNKVANFDRYRNEIVYSAEKSSEDGTPVYEIGVLNLGNDKTTTINTSTSPSLVSISRFYDKINIYVLTDNVISIYDKNKSELIKTYDITFSPTNIAVSFNGDFVVMSSGQNIATLDLEAERINEWAIDGDTFAWLDNDMLYSIKDGKLYVYDPDGLNRRQLSENVSSRFPVTTTNDKWLYYFSDESLIREIIAK